MTVNTFRPYISHALMYSLPVYMRELIGVLMRMMFTVFRVYSMSTKWSLPPLQMKIIGLNTMEFHYGQIQSIGELLRVGRFQRESAITWMRLSQGHQSNVIFASKKGTPDEDAQPYTLQSPTGLAQATN